MRISSCKTAPFQTQIQGSPGGICTARHYRNSHLDTWPQPVGLYSQMASCLLSKSYANKRKVTGWEATQPFASPAWSDWSPRPVHQYFENALRALWKPGAIQRSVEMMLTTHTKKLNAFESCVSFRMRSRQPSWLKNTSEKSRKPPENG